MPKVIIGYFSLITLLFLCVESSACPASDDCAATKLTVNSFGISVRVVIVADGRETPANRNEVEAFYLRQGEWQSIGRVLEGPGGFGWKSEWVGNYKFVIRQQGLRTA